MTRHVSRLSKAVSTASICALLLLTGCSTPEERAQAHYESGKELLEKGEHIKAALEFRNAVRLNDKLVVAWAGLAAAEEKRVNWPAVSDSLNHVVELDAKNFDATFKLAKLQLAAIQLDNALRNANKANDLKPNDSDVAALRAAILMRLNDKEGAVKEAERSLSINPSNPDALAVLAAEAISRRSSASALTFIERGLQTDSKNIGLLLFKVKIYEDNGDRVKLEETLRTLIGYYPQQKEFRQSLMSFLLQIGRTEDVERELRAYVDAETADTPAALDLVRLVSRLRGQAAGRAELETLASKRTEKVEFQLALSKLNFNEKKFDDAYKILLALVERGEPQDDVNMAKLMMAEFDRQQNKLEDANKLITEVIEQDPKNADALALRATGKIEKNDLSGAVSDLREALDQKPDSVQIRVILARAYERQGAIELARDEFSQVLKESGYNPEIAMQYIDMLRRRGSYDAMELVLEEAINRNPSNIMLVTTLAELRLNKGDWNGAEAIANALLKIDANSEVGKRIKAGVQLGKKQFDESIDTLKQAIDPAKPVSGSAMAALVTTYLQAGKVKEAEDFVNATLAANPESVDALMLLGNIRYAQRRSSEAEAQYRKVIELRPKLASGYFSLARMFASEKRSDEAIEILKKGREAAPIDLGSSLLLASIYEIRGSVEEAIKIYEEQLAATPDVLVVVNNLASLLADFRSEPESQERAQALARRLESIDVPQFKDTVGWVAYLKGDLRTAQVNLQDAVKRLPEVAAVRYHLGMTLAGMKRNDEAKAELQKASELAGPDDPLNKKIDEALKTLQTAAVAP